MNITNRSKTPFLTSILLSLALIVSACAAKEPVGGSITTQAPTTKAPTTTETPPDPRLLTTPECDDDSDCGAGFTLAGVFYTVGCTAIKEELVSVETLGGGDYLGTEVTVNLIDGVDPTRFVALSFPGGQCNEGDEPTSPWSIAYNGRPSAADVSAVCQVGLLTEAQLIANACIGQIVPPTGDELPAAVAQEVDAVMSGFFDALPTDNVAAREFYSGYPTPARKNTLFTQFVRNFDWMKTRTPIRWEIVGAAGSTGSAVAVITDDFDRGGSFVLSPSTGDQPALIQRLPELSAGRFTPSDRSRISGGNTVVFQGVATGDEVKAYLGSSELTQVTVNRAAGTISVVLPEVLPPLVTVTISSATAELPRAATAVYFYRP